MSVQPLLKNNVKGAIIDKTNYVTFKKNIFLHVYQFLF